MNKLGISINRKNCEMIPAYAAAGFEVMEISLPAVSVEEQRALGERAMQLAEECGLELWSVHIPFCREMDISAPEEDKRLHAVDLLLPSVALAKEWGAQVVVVHGSSEPNEDSSRGARIIACAQSLKALQTACGSMRLALENLPRTCIARNSGETVPLSKNCSGVCFDVNHLLMEDHASFMKQAAPFIITTHLSDYDGEDEKHWMPGAGVVPWKLVYDTLTEAGYQGPWLFELGANADGNPLDPVAVLSSWKKESGIE